MTDGPIDIDKMLDDVDKLIVEVNASIKQNNKAIDNKPKRNIYDLMMNPITPFVYNSLN